MMEILSKSDLQQLIRIQDPCCVSIFMPTHRAAGIEQDQIRFKNLLGQAEDCITHSVAKANSTGDRLAGAERLIHDESFWRHAADGLALFMSGKYFRHWRLPLDFDELVVCANRFHIKPLLPFLSADGRFYILALSQNEARLFQCSRFRTMQIDLPDVAGGLRDTLGYDHESGTQLQFHTQTADGGQRRPAMFHGHAVDAGDHKQEIVQYFREVDRSVQRAMGTANAPLVLAGVDNILSLYRNISAYAHVLDDGIIGNPERRRADELHAAAWEIVQPYFMKNQKEALARYHHNAGSGLTFSDLRQIVPAARHARVEVLFVALDRERWGRYDPDQNTVRFHDRLRDDSEDLLNRAAIETLINGGTVYGLETDQFPEPKTSAAALLRF